MKLCKLMVFSSFIIALVALPLTAACGGGDDEETATASPTATGEKTTQRAGEVTVTIGNLTDKTGPTANALGVMDMALEDTASYFNEENLIPGVNLKIVEYDTAYQPANYIPGYLWLRDKGANVIYCADPGAAEGLKSRADQDQFVMFSSTAQEALLGEPGYVFTASNYPPNLYYTLLDWIAENDWDYESRGPAKIGVANWSSSLDVATANGVEQYCQEHPEQFQWEGAYLKEMSFSWPDAAQGLKDCDYVLPPTAALVTFLKDYKSVSGEAGFIGGDPHVGFFRLVGDAGMWDEIDDMLLVRESGFWGDEGEMMELSEKLLDRYRADSQDEIKAAGGTYNAVWHYYIIFDIIKQAAAEVGPENVDSQAIYEAAQSYSLTLDGVERYSFSETKRFGCDKALIYKVVAEDETIERADQELIPVMRVFE